MARNKRTLADRFAEMFPESHVAYDLKKFGVAGGGFGEALEKNDITKAYMIGDLDNRERLRKLANKAGLVI